MVFRCVPNRADWGRFGPVVNDSLRRFQSKLADQVALLLALRLDVGAALLDRGDIERNEPDVGNLLLHVGGFHDAALGSGARMEPANDRSTPYGVSTTFPIPERASTISWARRASCSGRTSSISTFSLPSAATWSASLKLSGVSIGFPKIVITFR